MKVVNVIVAITLMTISLPLFAASATTGYVEIKTIRAGGGFLRVIGKTPFNDPSNCGGSGTNLSVIILESTKSYKEIVSIVLSARMSGKKVQFWVNGCTTDSGSQFPSGLFVYL